MTDPSAPYFLSKENPVANTDQRDAEEQALRILAMPMLKEARKRVAFLWRLAVGKDASPQAWEMFEAAMDENVFNYVMKATASDGNYPRIVRDFMPPHEWFGRQVPGARMGGDNPDNCYRLIGIAHGARYEIRGRIIGEAPPSVTFTLTANYGTSKTIQTLEWDDVQREDDGSFTIVIDNQPAAGRVNHLCTGPRVRFLFIRDSLENWTTQTPLALTVRRIDPPDAPPLTDAQVAERAVTAMIEEVPLYFWFTRLYAGQPANQWTVPVGSGALGGLVTQAGSQGWLNLQDDDAMVVTVDPAGAKYSSLVAHDWWFRSLDYWKGQTCLTSSGTQPNDDGSYTVVFAHKDTGLYNWIDTMGVREVPVIKRWQGLPRVQVRNGPTLQARLVKLGELNSALPKNFATVTAAERRKQLEGRAAAFARRLLHT